MNIKFIKREEDYYIDKINGDKIANLAYFLGSEYSNLLHV